MTGAHVLLVHHTGKDTERGARGHSSLRAAVDTEIEISRSGNESVVKTKKQRDLEGDGRPAFTLETVVLGIDDDGDEVTSCCVRYAATSSGKPAGSALGPLQREVLRELADFLKAHGSEVDLGPGRGVVRAASEDDFKRHAAGLRGGNTRSRNRAVKDALDGMLKRDLVRLGEGYLAPKLMYVRYGTVAFGTVRTWAQAPDRYVRYVPPLGDVPVRTGEQVAG